MSTTNLASLAYSVTWATKSYGTRWIVPHSPSVSRTAKDTRENPVTSAVRRTLDLTPAIACFSRQDCLGAVYRTHLPALRVHRQPIRDVHIVPWGALNPASP